MATLVVFNDESGHWREVRNPLRTTDGYGSNHAVLVRHDGENLGPDLLTLKNLPIPIIAPEHGGYVCPECGELMTAGINTPPMCDDCFSRIG